MFLEDHLVIYLAPNAGEPEYEIMTKDMLDARAREKRINEALIIPVSLLPSMRQAPKDASQIISYEEASLSQKSLSDYFEVKEMEPPLGEGVFIKKVLPISSQKSVAPFIIYSGYYFIKDQKSEFDDTDSIGLVNNQYCVSATPVKSLAAKINHAPREQSVIGQVTQNVIHSQDYLELEIKSHEGTGIAEGTLYIPILAVRFRRPLPIGAMVVHDYGRLYWSARKSGYCRLSVSGEKLGWMVIVEIPTSSDLKYYSEIPEENLANHGAMDKNVITTPSQRFILPNASLDYLQRHYSVGNRYVELPYSYELNEGVTLGRDMSGRLVIGKTMTSEAEAEAFINSVPKDQLLGKMTLYILPEHAASETIFSVGMYIDELVALPINLVEKLQLPHFSICKSKRHVQAAASQCKEAAFFRERENSPPKPEAASIVSYFCNVL